MSFLSSVSVSFALSVKPLLFFKNVKNISFWESCLHFLILSFGAQKKHGSFSLRELICILVSHHLLSTHCRRSFFDNYSRDECLDRKFTKPMLHVRNSPERKEITLHGLKVDVYQEYTKRMCEFKGATDTDAPAAIPPGTDKETNKWIRRTFCGLVGATSFPSSGANLDPSNAREVPTIIMD